MYRASIYALNKIQFSEQAYPEIRASDALAYPSHTRCRKIMGRQEYGNHYVANVKGASHMCLLSYDTKGDVDMSHLSTFQLMTLSPISIIWNHLQLLLTIVYQISFHACSRDMCICILIAIFYCAHIACQCLKGVHFRRSHVL